MSKRRKLLYILDLDRGTYESSSTESGAFDEQPDQIARIVGDDILYFCEDGGPGIRKGGVHAREGSTGRFFTITAGRGVWRLLPRRRAATTAGTRDLARQSQMFLRGLAEPGEHFRRESAALDVAAARRRRNNARETARWSADVGCREFFDLAFL